MNFVFCDKCKPEMEIITDVLYSEKIPYKINRFLVKDFIFDDNDNDTEIEEDNENNEDDEDSGIVIIEEKYDIICFTDLDHFDFIKYLANEKIKKQIYLERNYLLPAYVKGKKKRVLRVFKKTITNTNKRNRSKQK